MKVIAHRGSSQLAPENTLPAISRAIRDGADAVEIDVQLTKDHECIVFHDEWLNRTTNGKGFICDTPYGHIRTLDAGSWFSKRFRETRVPSLDQVLSLVSRHPVELHIELKNNLIVYKGLEEKVIDLVQQYQMEDQVVISSFRRESLEKCLALAPNIRRGYLCWSTTRPLFAHYEWRHLQLYSVHPHVSLMDTSLMRLQRLGYRIFPYPVDRKRFLRQCITLGVDGLFTNSPKKVKQMIKNHNAS
ncbi:glycerophosphodiester phosphodiesterase [Caldalkalibacillus salinus]|uniref:glycerophosphodiester phosphodiesterase n=1 Tax=Caldalkalibacillus salinus TaxID=2803787 RepID=UPI001921BE99|nr:glycerophosphodiester phosphodiesterase family protein [Caldalkalibacillus salinus]